MADTLKITLVKSPIGAIPKQKATVEALGLQFATLFHPFCREAHFLGIVACILLTEGSVFQLRHERFKFLTRVPLFVFL